MSRAPSPTAPKRAAARQAVKTVNLALQGGGSHGAYTWGVLDALAEDTRIEISAISGASAGTMNAVVFASGMDEGGREGAREKLEKFWLSVSSEGSLAPFRAQMGRQGAFAAWGGFWPGSRWIDAWTEAVSGILSPYEFNPFNVNPLRGPSRTGRRFRAPAREQRSQAVYRGDERQDRTRRDFPP